MPKLDVGCGANWHPGYVRLDIDPDVTPDILADVSQGVPGVPSDSMDEILCWHVLEHIPHPRQIAALKEMARMLKPDGTLFVIVPHPGADAAMVPGHCHVLSPRYWRDVQALPENWFGVPFVVDSVEVKFDEEALVLSGRTADYAERFLRNVALETHVRGHKCARP